MLQCLTDIVGVTDSTAPCITEGLSTGQLTQLKKSVSGLYLDDLPGGVHMKALKHADDTKPFYDMATDSLLNAAKFLEDDIVVALNNKYKKARMNFVGQIGRPSFAQSLGVSRQYQGIRLKPVAYSDAVATVTSLMLIVNESQSFKIYLHKVPYGSTMGEEIRRWDITTTANAYATLVIDAAEGGLKLPFVENGVQYEYWFFWDRVEAGGTVQPKDTKIECATCGKTAGTTLADFVRVDGVQFDSLAGLNYANYDQYSHGFILNVSIKCDNSQLFCREYNDQEAVAVTMARAVWFKAGELLIEEVIKSPNINRYTTMAKEYLWGKRNHFRTEYDGRIKYLADVIDVSASNCYICRQVTNQPFHAGIFS